ncbi:hypothetical protein PR048_017370 [Dryococelus australis]|uniref:Uncharacterized protein n=1 Tax=Dryococelus australis TaxID=614101 RepID=A0ABQ9H9D7_9NEOP|nr:hypothetical protein PR048_017370 [Dryococelus australis]
MEESCCGCNTVGMEQRHDAIWGRREILHDYHMPKSWSGFAGDRIRFALMEGDHSSRYVKPLLRQQEWSTATEVVAAIMKSEWLDYSPPTLVALGSIVGGVAPGFSHLGIVSDDATGQRVSSGSPTFPALAFPCCSIPHFTLIGSQDLDIKRRSWLSGERPRRAATGGHGGSPGRRRLIGCYTTAQEAARLNWVTRQGGRPRGAAKRPEWADVSSESSIATPARDRGAPQLQLGIEEHRNFS